MAWRAYVAQDIFATQAGLLEVTIWYYDDADPANAGVTAGPPPVPPTNIVWAKTWDLPIGTTTAQLQAAVIQEGQKARSWKQAEATADVSVPRGTNITIP